MAVRAKKDATRGLRINMIIDYINKRTPYGGVSIHELAEKYGVSERQIRRDLKTIQDNMGYALIKKEQVVEGKKVGKFCFEVGYLPSLSPEKATVVFLSILQNQGSALAGHINELKNVLVSTLFKYHYNPSELAVDRLQNCIHLVEEALAEPEQVGEIFVKLVQALKDCHRVKIWYYVAYNKQETERVVEPYGLICKRQNWYLVAHCLTRQSIRVFRIDQIMDVHAYISEKFSYPAGFSLKEHMAQSWGVINDGDVCRVRLKFSPEVAFRVRNMVYHPSQKLEEELADGSILVSFQVCGLEEMKTWIVQWGKHVEVLEPHRLRQDMCRWAEDILQVYR